MNENKGTKQFYSNNNQPLQYDHIVVLTSEMTASASEVMLMSLVKNLNDQVTHIGTKTFGKNTQISIREFRRGAGAVFISGIMEEPKGVPLNPDGITPEIEVKNKGEGDAQLDKAIEFLHKK